MKSENILLIMYFLFVTSGGLLMILDKYFYRTAYIGIIGVFVFIYGFFEIVFYRK